MNDSAQGYGSAGSGAKPPAEDWREERRRWRAERRAARRARYGGSWIGGAVLIVLGLVFLLQNLQLLALENWWALFILIPAIGAFASAWRSYQDAGGHLTAGARGSLMGGLVLTLITAVFLFSLDWGILAPVLLILLGVGLLVNVLFG